MKHWWCVVGTHVLIVEASTKQEAQDITADRMNDARRRTGDRIRQQDVHAKVATDAQLRRFEELTRAPKKEQSA